MNADRTIELWMLVVEQARGGPVTVGHVGAAVVAATGVDGVAVAVAVSRVVRETVYASDRVAAELEELTLMIGEGPSADALTGGGPVLAEDVTAADCLARWPVFAPAAARAGARAVLVLPLQIGAIGLGVLEMYRAEPGGLDGGQLADALGLADAACLLLLDGADRAVPHPAGGRPPPAGGLHPVVHQATGMITVQLGVSAEVALFRLRAHAYAHDRRLRDVAGDVVARRLRFDPEPGADHGDRP